MIAGLYILSSTSIMEILIADLTKNDEIREIEGNYALGGVLATCEFERWAQGQDKKDIFLSKIFRHVILIE